MADPDPPATTSGTTSGATSGTTEGAETVNPETLNDGTVNDGTGNPGTGNPGTADGGAGTAHVPGTSRPAGTGRPDLAFSGYTGAVVVDPAPTARRRGPDPLALLVGLATLAMAVFAFVGELPDLSGVDPRWLLAGGAAVVGLVLLVGSLRGRSGGRRS